MLARVHYISKAFDSLRMGVMRGAFRASRASLSEGI